MKEFVTAVQAEDDADIFPDVEFKVDGEALTAYGPTSGQYALMIAAMGDMVSTPQYIATSINFLFSLLDTEDRQYIQQKLFDREDPFGAREIADILVFLVEEWSGRPTKSPSDSATSRSNGGRKSTATKRTGASTH